MAVYCINYYGKVMNEFEREFLLRELCRQHGSKKKTADALGMNYRSLMYRLKALGITSSVLVQRPDETN